MEISYELVYYKDAVNDMAHWKKSGDKQAIKKINEILDILEPTPIPQRQATPKN